MRKYIVAASAAFTRRTIHFSACHLSHAGGATSPSPFQRTSTTRTFPGNRDILIDSGAATHPHYYYYRGRRPYITIHDMEQRHQPLAFAPPTKPSSRRPFVAGGRRWNDRQYHCFTSEANKHGTITPRCHCRQTTRLFGSNPNSPDAKPGQINLTDDRDIYIANYNDEDDDDDDHISSSPITTTTTSADDDTNAQIKHKSKNENKSNNDNNNNNINNNLPSTTANIIPINLPALRRTIDLTRQILGYPTYDVSLTLVSSPTMRQINKETRGVDSPTDILSFCFQDDFVKPGVLGEVQFESIGEYYCLGDMVLDVEYVARRCDEDRAMLEEEEERRKRKEEEDGVVVEVVEEKEEEEEEEDVADSGTGTVGATLDSRRVVERHSKEEEEEEEEGEEEGKKNDDDDDDGYEYEWIEVDEYDDRGVAPAMLKVFDPEVRCHMLVVHGMLHLVGYDHIEDDDYELMVEREDEVLAELRKILGDNFGVGAQLPEGGVSSTSS